jgi:arginase family enzyme
MSGAPSSAGAWFTQLEPACLATQHAQIASFDNMEVNPLLDHDGQSARWTAMVVWFCVTGLVRNLN